MNMYVIDGIKSSCAVYKKVLTVIRHLSMKSDVHIQFLNSPLLVKIKNNDRYTDRVTLFQFSSVRAM